jgi:N-acetylneuraminic acid mutarotase
LDGSYKTLQSVEVLDLANNVWSAAPPMGEKRSSCAAAVAGGKLYVFGGVSTRSRGELKSVEVLDGIGEAS